MSRVQGNDVGVPAGRWVMEGYYGGRRYNWPQCRYCGRAQSHDCKLVVCPLCESPQCHGNGGGNGTCAVCLYGWLPGWYHENRECGYKGCTQEATAKAPRVGRVCADHVGRVKVRLGGENVTLRGYVETRIADRDEGKGWQRWRLVA